jgi:hypothetical protein
VGQDSVDSRWPTHDRILSEIQTWPPENHTVIISEDDSDVGQLPFLAITVSKWMEDAKRVAVAHFHQVLKDGPEICLSDRENEGADQDDSAALGQVLERRHQMTQAQVQEWHRTHGRAGGQETVWETG